MYEPARLPDGAETVFPGTHVTMDFNIDANPDCLGYGVIKRGSGLLTVIFDSGEDVDSLKDVA